jgi:hypothetical protein
MIWSPPKYFVASYAGERQNFYGVCSHFGQILHAVGVAYSLGEFFIIEELK